MTRAKIFLLLLPFLFGCSGNKKDYMGEILSFDPESIHYQILEPGESPDFLKNSEFNASSSESSWTLSKKNSISFGFSNKDVWLAIRAKNTSSEDQIVLEFGNPHIDEVLLFNPGNPNPIKRAGDFVPHSEWDLYSKSVAVLLPWKSGTDKLLYARISTTSAIYLGIKLHTKNGFDLKENKENSVIGFFYGTIVIMVIYNLFIYFILKDFSYILYSFSILANLLVQCFLNGISNYIFTPDDPMIHNRLGSIFVCLSAMCSWTFALYFLNCKKYVPKADITLKVLIGLVLVYLILLINLIPLNFVVKYTQIVAQDFCRQCFCNSNTFTQSRKQTS
jgi:two-component system, sensor histidine kinase LadS